MLKKQLNHKCNHTNGAINNECIVCGTNIKRNTEIRSINATANIPSQFLPLDFGMMTKKHKHCNITNESRNVHLLIRFDKACVSIWKSGKMMFMGMKSVEEIEKRYLDVIDLIKKSKEEER